MPRPAITDSQRMNLRITPEAKARLSRAAALSHLDLTSFVTQSALREADAVIEADDTLRLSARDHAQVMALLDAPSGPNDRLRRAIAALPDHL